MATERTDIRWQDFPGHTSRDSDPVPSHELVSVLTRLFAQGPRALGGWAARQSQPARRSRMVRAAPRPSGQHGPAERAPAYLARLPAETVQPPHVPTDSQEPTGTTQDRHLDVRTEAAARRRDPNFGTYAALRAGEDLSTGVAMDPSVVVPGPGLLHAAHRRRAGQRRR